MIKFEASVEKKDHTVVNCYTTSMDELMDFLGKYENDYQWVIDHETGELLFRANHPTAEDYADEHFELMCLGWMMSGLEPTPDPRAELMKDILEVCQEFGVDLRIPN
ncbi:MAG: hypothetical protein IKZ00_03355 [Bacteroidaceae bacterium]|nr:hypothetical protein [Bacteroidaceae bacterium]